MHTCNLRGFVIHVQLSTTGAGFLGRGAGCTINGEQVVAQRRDFRDTFASSIAITILEPFLSSRRLPGCFALVRERRRRSSAPGPPRYPSALQGGLAAAGPGPLPAEGPAGELTGKRASGGGGVHSCLSKRLLSLSTSARGRIAPPRPGSRFGAERPQTGDEGGMGPGGSRPRGWGEDGQGRQTTPVPGKSKGEAVRGEQRPCLGSSGHLAPSPPLKANGSARCPRPVRGATDATNLVTPGTSSIPLRARCPQRRRAAGTGTAGDSLTAPALPAPALGDGSRAIRCQSRAGKLDLNWEKQKTSSQRRCSINRVLQ